MQKPERRLARGVIAEGDVHVRVDESGAGGDAVRVEDQIAILEVRIRDRAHLRELVALHQNGVALHERRAPVARKDAAEVDDCGFHGHLTASTR